jgi:hypothetical protein
MVSISEVSFPIGSVAKTKRREFVSAFAWNPLA